MKFSIALCTYNGAKFLSEQLESLLRQTRQPDELVVCDDCSTDETVKILKDFALKSSFPVRIDVNENNLGSTKNFEKAISLCTGDITFLCDQDDVWLPNKIERMMKEFENSAKVGLVFSNAELVDENLHSLEKTLWDYNFDEKVRQRAEKDGLVNLTLRERNIMMGAAAAFRTAYREFFLPIPTQIPGIIHDGWIALIVASRAEVVLIDELLIKYRQHSLQQIGVLLSKETIAEDKDFKQFCNRLIKINENQKQRLCDIENAMTELENRVPSERGKFSKLLDAIRVERRKIQQSTEHLTCRRDLPAARAKRLKAIINEFVSGRYRQFGRGFVSAAKDLIRD